MRVLVTGAAGFLGTRVASALLAGADGLPPVTTLVAADTAACRLEDRRVEHRIGTVTDEDFVTSIAAGADLVFHLAAALSGQSEAEFDLGMRVNVGATRLLLEACRGLAKPPRVVFTSTVAVFGGPLPEVVPEDIVVTPQSAYGTGKAMSELLVNEYSRRGFIDGLSCRVPTVAIRPGAPNSAMSSFVSGIIREPLAGIPAVCPVPLDTRLWISSPDVLLANLVHAARIDTSHLDGRRMINLPGLTVTPAEMLLTLERVGGAEARARVRCEPDERIMRIVGTWPGAFDTSRARRLGFVADRDFDGILRQFMAEAHGVSADGGRHR
jgi:D-erythronate 2-dehydrogenase